MLKNRKVCSWRYPIRTTTFSNIRESRRQKNSDVEFLFWMSTNIWLFTIKETALILLCLPCRSRSLTGLSVSSGSTPCCPQSLTYYRRCIVRGDSNSRRSLLSAGCGISNPLPEIWCDTDAPDSLVATTASSSTSISAFMVCCKLRSTRFWWLLLNCECRTFSLSSLPHTFFSLLTFFSLHPCYRCPQYSSLIFIPQPIRPFSAQCSHPSLNI